MAIHDDLSGNAHDPALPAELPPPGAHPTPGGSPFPPIADYGFLSDCEVTALVASSGNVEWMCLPRMDSPSLFAAVLDRGAGRFGWGPRTSWCPTGAVTCRGR